LERFETQCNYNLLRTQYIYGTADDTSFKFGEQVELKEYYPKYVTLD